MVWKVECDCNERSEITVDSVKLFNELVLFFNDQVEKGIFEEVAPKQAYYVWKENERIKEWFATKWYRCRRCGCLWEFNYPDFPAKGFVRKFPDGHYSERGF